MSKRPLISVRDKNPFASAMEAHTNDLTELKGYSDKRRQIDDDERRGREASVQLSHRFHYVTVQRPNGRPDGQKATQFRALGYRFVKWDEAPNLGIEVPIHAEQTPDGFIKVGDAQLMVCDAATAAKIEAQGRSAIDERTSIDSTAGTLHSQAKEINAVGQGNPDTEALTWHKQSRDIGKG